MTVMGRPLFATKRELKAEQERELNRIAVYREKDRQIDLLIGLVDLTHTELKDEAAAALVWIVEQYEDRKAARAFARVWLGARRREERGEARAREELEAGPDRGAGAGEGAANGPLDEGAPGDRHDGPGAGRTGDPGAGEQAEEQVERRPPAADRSDVGQSTEEGEG